MSIPLAAGEGRVARTRTRLLAGLAVLAVMCGCSGPTLQLPAPIAPQPMRCAAPNRSTGLYAGFGRADITPPPGVGLAGYAVESQRAKGYRHRLYARAMVLEDETAGRLAFVIVDLPQVSIVLQRRAAVALSDSACLGADRLLLAATHTHAGPGHFFSSTLINEAGSAVTGYDPLVVDFLVKGIASSVQTAVRNLRPAAAAWGTTEIWGYTRNRSIDAYRRDRPSPPLLGTLPPSRALLDDRHLAVDPTLTMLRVDTIGPSGDPAPAGAFSVFAIHGTGNPAANALFDGDIHALVQRGLERHIDRLSGSESADAPPAAVHLFANGASGDVSPDWPDPPEDRLCPIPVLERARPAPGPRSPPAPFVWKPGSAAAIARCLATSRAYVNSAGDSLARYAIDLYEQLGRGPLRRDIQIRRAFRTLRLTRDATALHICPEPRVGTSIGGGSPDGRSRIYKWKIAGLFSTGFDDEGGGIKTDAQACHAPKRIAGGILQRALLGGHAFPEDAQLMVVQLGATLVAAIPWEVTTVAGYRIRRGIERIARDEDLDSARAVVVGLADGYLHYVTTPEEYALQRYEGGWNLYGPRTAAMLEAQLGKLTRDLLRSPEGIAEVSELTAHPGPAHHVFPTPHRRRPPKREIRSLMTSGDTVVIRWTDAYPGDLIPADGPVLRIERLDTADRWIAQTWDDDRFLEVRALEPAGGDAYLWEMRWSGCVLGTSYRVVLVARMWHDQELGVLTSEPFGCQ